MAKKKKDKIKLDFSKFNNSEPVYVQGSAAKGIALKIQVDDGFLISSDDENEFILTSPTNQKT